MRCRRRDRGSALLLCVIISLIVIGISGAYVTISLFSSRQTANSSFALQAIYIAEAGAARFIAQLNRPALGVPEQGPSDYLGGRYQIVNIVSYDRDGIDNDGNGQVDDAFEARFQQFTSEGTFAGIRRRLQVVISGNPGGAFWNAVFAGNSSNDPNYNLFFGGPADRNTANDDRIHGDVYSGGGIQHQGDGRLLNVDGTGGSNQVMYNRGSLSTSSSQTPPPHYVQGPQPNLDILSMRYSDRANDTLNNPNFVNVKNDLETKGRNGAISGSPTDGVALQINDRDEPSHIFRMDPKDDGVNERTISTTGMDTAKHDFFLEDPTRGYGNGTPQGSWNNQGDPDNSWVASDGGMRVEISPTGNNKVYFIDGNLWVHNRHAFTYQFMHNQPAGMKITFVVQGNVYLSDNLVYQRDTFWSDALAIIAVNDSDPRYQNASPADFMPGGRRYDPGVTDPVAAAREYNALNGSGNIFFGDRAYGTTERFEAFMYAENNFYDNNLGAAGTSKTNVFGNMTAGNQVQIQRQSAGGYKPLWVQFDERIRTGAVIPPGLPPVPQVAAQDWVIASWRPVP